LTNGLKKYKLCNFAHPLGESGKELKKNKALLHTDYDLTLREIRRRLKAGSNEQTNKKNTAKKYRYRVISPFCTIQTK
jgi:hypothetical protein